MISNSSFRSLMRSGIAIAVSILLAAASSSAQKAVKAKTGDAQQTTTERSEKDIDAVQVSPDKFKILLENENVRVVEYSLKPGERDNWHTHPPKTSYVISGGKLKIFLENGESFVADEKKGSASWMDHLGKHHAENIGDSTVIILFTEIKNVRGK